VTGHWAALEWAAGWAIVAVIVIGAASAIVRAAFTRARRALAQPPAPGHPAAEGAVTPGRPAPVPGPRLPPGPADCTVRIWRCSCRGVWREGILGDRYLCGLHATPEWAALEQEVWGK